MTNMEKELKKLARFYKKRCNKNLTISSNPIKNYYQGRYDMLIWILDTFFKKKENDKK